MDVYVRDIHNNMIKPLENGGLDNVVYSVTNKLMISDTILRSFIPPQIREMTPKLRDICGCELCIIPKDMQIYLNIFRTRRVIYLQQKYVVRHKHNSLFSTTSNAHYKDIVFT